MGFPDILLHLLSFAAPALAVACVLAAGGRLIFPRQRGRLSWWAQIALDAGVGVAVLALGLWHFGVDGKMATYTALVLVMAAAHWLASAGWRS